MKIFNYNVHDLIKVSSNMEILHYYFEDKNPTSADLVISIRDLNVDTKGSIRTSSNCFLLEDGSFYYERAAPLIGKIDAKKKWKILIKDIFANPTYIDTDIPYFSVKPVYLRVRALLYSLMVTLLNIKLVEQEKCFIHSACMSINENGFGITGLQRTGKTSTAIQLSQEGFNYLSDDLTIVDPKGKAYCYPTARTSKESYSFVDKTKLKLSKFPLMPLFIWGPPPLMRSETIPTTNIKKLYILEHGPNNIIRLDEEEATKKLIVLNENEFSPYKNSIMEALPYLYQDEFIDYFTNYKGIIKKFVSNIDCYILRCNDSDFYKHIIEE